MSRLVIRAALCCAAVLACGAAAAIPPQLLSITTAEPSPTTNSEVTFAVEFDQDVTGFTSQEVTLNYLSASPQIDITGGPAVYQVRVFDLFLNGALSITVGPSANIVNGFSEPLLGTATSPSIQIDAGNTVFNGFSVVGGGGYFVGESVEVDASFSGAVTGFDEEDVLITPSTATYTGFQISGGPQFYTITISGLAGEGSLIVSTSGVFSALDGNDQEVQPPGFSSLTLGIDRVPPVATLPGGPVDIISGQDASFTIQFSEAVTDVDSADFTVITDGVSFDVLDVSGSGALYEAKLVNVRGEGTFTFQLGPIATIFDIAGNAVLPNPEIITGNVTLNRPKVLAFAPSSAGPSNADSASFALSFNRAVINVDESDFVVQAPDGLSYTSLQVSGADDSYTIEVQGLEGEGSLALAFSPSTDIGENGGEALGVPPASDAITIDRVAPTVLSFEPEAAALSSGGAAVARVVFSEVVTGLDGSFIATGDAAAGATLSVLAGTPGYLVTASPVEGTGQVSIGFGNNVTITDLAGNAIYAPSGSATFTVLPQGPRVQAITDPYNSRTNANPVAFTVQFSDANVTSLDPAAIRVEAGAGQNPQVSIANATLNRFEVRVGGLTGEGTVSIHIDEGALLEAGVLPVALGGTSGDVEFDYNGPTYSFDAPEGIYAPNTPIVVQVNFSEAVRSFRAANVTASLSSPATSLTPVVEGSGAVYTITLPGVPESASGAVSVSLKGTILDIAGNPAVPSGALTLPIDFSPPALVDISPESGVLDAEDAEIAIAFSEPVTGFGLEDVTVLPQGVAIASFSGSSGDLSYTITLAPTTSKSAQLVLQLGSEVVDLNGNPLTQQGAFTKDFSLDAAAPQLLSVSPGAEDVILDAVPRPYVFTFSEPVEVAAGAVEVLRDGEVDESMFAQVQPGDEPWKVIVLAEAAGDTLQLRLKNEAVTDRVGRPSEDELATPVYTVDLSGPKVPVLQAQQSVVQAGDVLQLNLATADELSAVRIAGIGEAYPSEEEGLYLFNVPNIRFEQDTSLDFEVTLTDIYSRSATYFVPGVATVQQNLIPADETAPVFAGATFAGYDSATHSAAFDVTFSEPVTGFTQRAGLPFDPIVVRHSGTSNQGLRVERTLGGADYRVTLLGVGGEGSVRIDVLPAYFITDLSGNALLSNGVGEAATIDAQAPEVVTFDRAEPGLFTGGDLVFQVVFHEPVLDFGPREAPVESFGVTYARVVTEVSGATATITVKGVSGNGWLRTGVGGNGEARDAIGNIIPATTWGPGVLVNTGVARFSAEAQKDAASDDAALIALLDLFFDADLDQSRFLDWSELLSAIPDFPLALVDAVDANSDARINVAEILAYRGGGYVHSADTNASGALELDEIIRVVQLYNAGAFACANAFANSEDGFVLVDEGEAPGGVECQPHAADYQDTDNQLSLSELLRTLQLYNAGSFTYCAGNAEDGFCPDEQD